MKFSKILAVGVALLCVVKSTERYDKLMVVLQEYRIIKKFVYYFLCIYLCGLINAAVSKVVDRPLDFSLITEHRTENGSKMKRCGIRSLTLALRL